MSKINVDLPDLKDLLKAGVQFGHETKRWNPKMKPYIFQSKNNIHVIDVTKTLEMLPEAVKFLVNASRKGSVIFVGTKMQIASIIEKEAIRSGAYFVSQRWAGGLLTNFPVIKQSLRKLRNLEESFETGVQDRTKYEIQQLKMEWDRLNRLYGGVKGMTRFPSAVVVVDPRYEIGAVLEARKLKIPVVGILDSNCDPGFVDYLIPANDDAIRSVELLMKTLADAVLEGNGGQGVKHNFKDYSKEEVKIIKSNEDDSKGKGDPKPEKSKGKIRIRSAAAKDAAKTKSPKKSTSSTKSASDISQRVVNILKKNNLSLEKAKKMSKDELLKIDGLGEATVNQILKG